MVLGEYVALLSFLDPPTTPDTKTKSQIKRPLSRTSGQKFLDHLSWLCDPLPRGRTVASIAVQGSSSGSNFWIASNNGSSRGVKKHLQWLLGRLRQLVDGSETREVVCKEIFRKSVNFSRERVRNYLEQLKTIASHCLLLQETNERGKDCLQLRPHPLNSIQIASCLRTFPRSCNHMTSTNDYAR